MSEPLWMICKNVSEIPSMGELVNLATLNQHIVLQFPLEDVGDNFDKYPIVESLRSHLLDCSVFDSGQRNGFTSITIKKVIDEAVILQNAILFKESIDRFLNLADNLLSRLAQKYGISVEQLSDWRFSEEFVLPTELLDDVWSINFHGQECRFRNKTTGQVVDISLSQEKDRYERVDPYFFAEYIQTTLGERETATFINDKFHDSHRILKVLFENNYF